MHTRILDVRTDLVLQAVILMLDMINREGQDLKALKILHVQRLLKKVADRNGVNLEPILINPYLAPTKGSKDDREPAGRLEDNG
jgi:hypothetical protein